MSFAAMAWAARQKLPPVQKLVLIMLANRHNGDSGRCDPSHARLAEDCGITRRSAMQQIATLEGAGYITTRQRRDGAKNLSNSYILHIGFGVQEKEAVHNDPFVVIHSGESNSPGVVNDVHQGSEPGSPKTRKEPVNKNRNTTTTSRAHTREAAPAAPGGGGGVENDFVYQNASKTLGEPAARRVARLAAGATAEQQAALCLLLERPSPGVRDRTAWACGLAKRAAAGELTPPAGAAAAPAPVEVWQPEPRGMTTPEGQAAGAAAARAALERMRRAGPARIVEPGNDKYSNPETVRKTEELLKKYGAKIMGSDHH